MMTIEESGAIRYATQNNVHKIVPHTDETETRKIIIGIGL